MIKTNNKYNLNDFKLDTIKLNYNFKSNKLNDKLKKSK